MRFSNVFLLDLPKCLWSVSQCLTTRVFGPWYWSRSNYWVAIVPPDGQSSGYECRKSYDYLLLTLNSLKLLNSKTSKIWAWITFMIMCWLQTIWCQIMCAQCFLNISNTFVEVNQEGRMKNRWTMVLQWRKDTNEQVWKMIRYICFICTFHDTNFIVNICWQQKNLNTTHNFYLILRLTQPTNSI